MEENTQNNNKLKPILGIIIPCNNEEKILPFTVNELFKVMGDLENNYAISEKSFISFIDDGSIDKTWEVISGFNRRFPEKIKGLKLSRNFGHQNALLGGMLNFKYDLCVTLDADLQDPPEIIVDMFKKYREGYDIVYGVRDKRHTDSILKYITAILFYKLIRILGIKTVYNHADFRLIKKEVVEVLKNFKEVNIFLRGIIPYIGFNSSIVYYERQKRKVGKTKYSLGRMLLFAWEGITSFTTFPLRCISIIGFCVFVLSLFLSIYSLIGKFLGKTIPGWTSIILAQYVLGGLIILFLGIVGEYVGKIYLEAKQRPRFIVEKKIE